MLIFNRESSGHSVSADWAGRCQASSCFSTRWSRYYSPPTNGLSRKTPKVSAVSTKERSCLQNVNSHQQITIYEEVMSVYDIISIAFLCSGPFQFSPPISRTICLHISRRQLWQQGQPQEVLQGRPPEEWRPCVSNNRYLDQSHKQGLHELYSDVHHTHNWTIRNVGIGPQQFPI